MRGTSVEQCVFLRNVVDIVENIAVGQEGQLRSGGEEASIEEKAAEEGCGVSLVDEENVVLHVLSLEERMHELEEGCEMLFPGSERDQDDNTSGGLTVGWPVVTPRSQHS